MVKLFKPYLKQLLQYRALLLFGFFLFVITDIASIALLGLAGWFISAAAFAGISAMTAAQFNYLLPGAGVRLFSYIRIAGRYGERLINHETIFRFIASIRLQLFQHLACLSPVQLNFVNNANLLNRFISDIGLLDNLFLRIITPVGSFMIIFILALLFLSMIKLSLAMMTFVFVTLIVFLLALSILYQPSIGNTASYQLALNQLRYSSTQIIQALREITLFNAKHIQIKLLETDATKVSQTQHRINKKNAFAQAILIEGIGLLVLLTLFMTVHLTLLHQLSGAYIAAIFLGVFAFGEQIHQLIMVFLSLHQTEEAANNINTLMTIKPQFTAPPHPLVNIIPSVYDLNIDNLSFSYSEQKQALFQQYHLQIAAKTHCALIGESGRGKSTLVNLIARFIQPDSGTITVNHQNIYQLTEVQWQSLFCIVPQRAFLFDTTLRENLMLANPNATDDMCWQALEVCQIKAFIQSLPNGLDTYVGKNGEHFSGGQARRLTLARAILKNAPITILDEPTDGLDQATEIALMQACRAFFREKTLIVISHRAAVIDLFPAQHFILSD